MAKITCSSEAISAKFMLILFTVLLFLACSIEAQSKQLPQDEVDALKEIAGQLGIGESVWNFSLNPCEGEWDFVPNSHLFNRSIWCTCSGGVWHVEKIGYMAPEYALWGYLTYKADVYSFGVVASEIVAGKNNMRYRPSEKYVCLLDWALVLQKTGNRVELVDPRLGSNFEEEAALRMIKVALLCTNPSPELRPTMSAVVGMLEGHIGFQEHVSDPSAYIDGHNFQGLRDKYDELQFSSNELQPSANSSDKKESGTFSTKSQDLYPLILDSQ